MELQKLGHQATHTPPLTAAHKTVSQPTDGKSTLAEAHAAEHEDTQPGCLECLQQCWDSLVKLVQDLWASLFVSAAPAHDEEVTQVDEAAAQAEAVAKEEAAYAASLALIQTRIDAWKIRFQDISAPCVVSGSIVIKMPDSHVPYRQSFTASFGDSVFAAPALVLLADLLNAFSQQIATDMNEDRARNARSRKNFGTESVGYQLPQSKSVLTLAYFVRGKAEGTCDVIYSKEEVSAVPITRALDRHTCKDEEVPKFLFEHFPGGSSKILIELYTNKILKDEEAEPTTTEPTQE